MRIIRIFAGVLALTMAAGGNLPGANEASEKGILSAFRAIGERLEA